MKPLPYVINYAIEAVIPTDTVGFYSLTMGRRNSKTYSNKFMMTNILRLNTVEDLVMGINYVDRAGFEYVLELTEESIIDKDANTIMGEFKFFIL